LFSPALPDAQGLGMYGQNRELRTVQCRFCQKHYALRLDNGDLARVVYCGALVQDVLPYLDSGERELLLTATCPVCWSRLCVPNSPFGYD
jgi:hypothetical protein